MTDLLLAVGVFVLDVLGTVLFNVFCLAVLIAVMLVLDWHNQLPTPPRRPRERHK